MNKSSKKTCSRDDSALNRLSLFYPKKLEKRHQVQHFAQLMTFFWNSLGTGARFKMSKISNFCTSDSFFLLSLSRSFSYFLGRSRQEGTKGLTSKRRNGKFPRYLGRPIQNWVE